MGVRSVPEHVMETFSSVMPHLDRLSRPQQLNFFAQLSNFARLIERPLRTGTEVSAEPVPVRTLKSVFHDLVDARIMLYDGESVMVPEQVVPFYEEALRYYAEARRSFSALRQFQGLYTIYRLWVPGLMTSRELAEFTGMRPNDVSNSIKRLRDDLGIIEQRTRGVYARGENGRTAMNLFAVMVALWRKADDVYSDLQVEQVARPVRYGLEQGTPFSVLDTLETRPVPITEVPICEPILVSEDRDEVRYSTSLLLYQSFLTTMDRFFDGRGAASWVTELEPLLRAGVVVRSTMRVSDAFRRAVSEKGMLFVRLGGQLRFVPPLCAQLVARG